MEEQQHKTTLKVGIEIQNAKNAKSSWVFLLAVFL